MSVPLQDATSSASSASASSLTFAHVCKGADRFLVVGAGERIVANTATYAGVSMTALTSVVNGAAIARQFILLNPQSGSNNIVVTFASSGNVCAQGISFTNTGGYRNNTTASGSSTTASLAITSETNDLVVDFVSHGDAAGITAGAGQTAQINTINANAQGTSTEAGAASVTMSWTAASSSVWAQSAISLFPADEIRLDTSSNGYSTASTSLTVSHTIGGGRNRCLFVGVEAQAGNNLTGVTYNGVAMTIYGTGQATGVAGYYNYMYYMKEADLPATGAYNIVASFSSSSTKLVMAESLYGIDQNTPIEADNAISTTGTNPAGSVTTLTAGAWVFGTSRINAFAPTAASGTTQRQNNGSDVGYVLWDKNAASSPAGTYALNTTSASQLYFFWTFAAKPAPSTVIKDVFSGFATSSASTTTISSFDATVGLNNVLIVSVSDQANSGAGWATNVTGVTCNGVAMTKIGVYQVNPGYGNSESLWGLINPTDGNIVATRTTITDQLSVIASLYSNVSQTTAIGSLVKTGAGTTQATSFTGTLTTVVNNSYTVLGTYISSINTATAGSNTFLRNKDSSINYVFDKGGVIPTAGSTSLNVTNGGNFFYAYVMVALEPVSVFFPRILQG